MDDLEVYPTVSDLPVDEDDDGSDDGDDSTLPENRDG